MFDIGNRYVQREETVHLAVELIDRLFLQGGDQVVGLMNEIFAPHADADPNHFDEEFEITRIKYLALFTMACYIIAAKYDELDENIPLISDI